VALTALLKYPTLLWTVLPIKGLLRSHFRVL
jgi:hypothetical protein